jgi:hypothetical protein
MYVSDPVSSRRSPISRILEIAAATPEGTPLSARSLLHLGSRAAIDQALSRLARRGALLRAGRGIYVRPIQTRFGVRSPSATAVLARLAEETGEIIVSHGAAVANALGLTTQVPMREIYLTSGPTRRLSLGALIIDLRHAPRWQLSGHRAGEAVRALHWLGQTRGASGIARLARILSKRDVTELLNLRNGLPNWLARGVSALAPHR